MDLRLDVIFIFRVLFFVSLLSVLLSSQ